MRLLLAAQLILLLRAISAVAPRAVGSIGPLLATLRQLVGSLFAALLELIGPLLALLRQLVRALAGVFPEVLEPLGEVVDVVGDVVDVTLEVVPIVVVVPVPIVVVVVIVADDIAEEAADRSPAGKGRAGPEGGARVGVLHHRRRRGVDRR